MTTPETAMYADSQLATLLHAQRKQRKEKQMTTRIATSQKLIRDSAMVIGVLGAMWLAAVVILSL